MGFQPVELRLSITVNSNPDGLKAHRTEFAMSPEQRLTELGLELPPAPKVLGLYKPVLVVGQFAYTSGHGPLGSDGKFITGCLGAELTPRPAKRPRGKQA